MCLLHAGVCNKQVQVLVHNADTCVCDTGHTGAHNARMITYTGARVYYASTHYAHTTRAHDHVTHK